MQDIYFDSHRRRVDWTPNLTADRFRRLPVSGESQNGIPGVHSTSPTIVDG
jgi:hypothetical protein